MPVPMTYSSQVKNSTEGKNACRIHHVPWLCKRRKLLGTKTYVSKENNSTKYARIYVYPDKGYF